MSYLIYAAVLAGLVALLAFFSVSETSLFSLRPWRVERLRRDAPSRGEILVRLLGDPLRLVVTLVIGAEMVTIAAGNVTAIFRREHLAGLGEYGFALALGVTSALTVLLGEITPKALAANYPEWAADLVARPLAAASWLLAPVARPLVLIASRIPKVARPEASTTLSEADFRLMVEMGMKEGVLGRREVEMIGAVFRLGDMPVRAVMVPRTDISALPASASFSDALAHIRQRRHSRVPLYEGNLDHIVGILYAKDMLGLPRGTGAPEEVRSLARPTFFVPEMTKARHLIREFQSRRLHVAIVVDEYGGTSGLVSLEDLLEEIVGDIADDFDRPVLTLRQMRKGLWWARGSLPFAEFKHRFRARAKAGDYDTLAGYVLKLLGRLPSEGEGVSDGQYTYTIVRISGRRIIEVMIEETGSQQRKGPGAMPGPSL